MVNRPRHVLPILINTEDKITDVVFSPNVPDTAIVLFAEQPPQLHNLRTAGVFNAFREITLGHAYRDMALMDSESLIPECRFRTPAVHAAYRPAENSRSRSDEFSVVFGEGDSATHRFKTSTLKRMSSPYIDNGCRVAYSNDGSVLVAGTTQGAVAAFALEGNDFAELHSHKFRGGITALCVEQDNCIVRVATDFNALVSFDIQGFEIPKGDWERLHFTPEDQNKIGAMKLNTVVASKRTGLIACAGIGNDIYVSGNDAHLGRRCKIADFNNIRKLQFVEERGELVVFGDGGLQVISWTLEGGIPVFDERTFGYGDVSEGVRLAGCHQYGNLLCAVLAIQS